MVRDMSILYPTGRPQPRAETWPASPSRQPPVLDGDISTDEDDLDVALLQRDPMSYFLTPATPMDEELEFDFGIDAGIEDPNNPREMVRSVSPSTLDGLKRYKPRNKAGSSGECAILDDGSDDDDEDYIRFSPSNLILRMPDFGRDRARGSPGKKASLSLSPSSSSSLSAGAGGTGAAAGMLAPGPQFHVGSPRGRSAKRFSPPRRPFHDSGSGKPALRRRHSWREPSPDVWSIEEEPEKETMSERGFSTEDLEALGRSKAQPIDIPAAKPKKRVRFVLPETA